MDHAPSRRSIARLLFAALVATASCVSVLGLEEENYGPLRNEICNYANELCSSSEFDLNDCLAGKDYVVDDHMMAEVEVCFTETECQDFLGCIKDTNTQQECHDDCVGIGETCKFPNCVVECCDGVCGDTRCCWPDGQGCIDQQECCSGGICVEGTCGDCIGALEPCNPGDPVTCCGSMACTEMPDSSFLCTQSCAGSENCTDFTDQCCDVFTGQCRAGDKCCNFGAELEPCLATAFGACTDAAIACCNEPGCRERVQATADCKNSSCIEEELSSSAGKALAACICQDNHDQCSDFCLPVGGGGSGGMGGSSSGGMGGSGG